MVVTEPPQITPEGLLVMVCPWTNSEPILSPKEGWLYNGTAHELGDSKMVRHELLNHVRPNMSPLDFVCVCVCAWLGNVHLPPENLEKLQAPGGPLVHKVWGTAGGSTRCQVSPFDSKCGLVSKYVWGPQNGWIPFGFRSGPSNPLKYWRKQSWASPRARSATFSANGCPKALLLFPDGQPQRSTGMGQCSTHVERTSSEPMSFSLPASFCTTKMSFHSQTCEGFHQSDTNHPGLRHGFPVKLDSLC